ELDADDGIEDVPGVRPGVHGRLTPARDLLPERGGADGAQVDADGRLRVALRQGEPPPAHVRLRMALAQMRIDVEGEHVAGRVAQTAAKAQDAAAGAEIDGGGERDDSRHEAGIIIPTMTSSRPEWSLPRRIGFRLAACYWVLYGLP